MLKAKPGKSGNIIHKIWGPPFRRALYTLSTSHHFISIEEPLLWWITLLTHRCALLRSSHLIMGAMSASPQLFHPYPALAADQDKWYIGAFTPTLLALCLTDFSSTRWHKHSTSLKCGWTPTLARHGVEKKGNQPWCLSHPSREGEGEEGRIGGV